jgi:hypothetical protein
MFYYIPDKHLKQFSLFYSAVLRSYEVLKMDIKKSKKIWAGVFGNGLILKRVYLIVIY